MSTTTIERPTEVAPEVELKTPTSPKKSAKKKPAKKDKAKASPVIKAGVEWMRNTTSKATKKVRRAGSKSWRSIRSGLRWLRRKAVQFWNWAKTGIRSLGKWLARTSRKVWAKTVSMARTSWAYMRSGAVRAWDWSAPFRGWLAGTSRGVLGAAVGFASLILFGGKVIAVTALFYGAYLLLNKKARKKVQARLNKANRRAKAKRKELKAKQKAKDAKRKARKAADKANKAVSKAEQRAIEASKADAEYRVATDSEVALVLSPTQDAALRKRWEELHLACAAASEKNDRSLLSEVLGQLYLLEQRLFGNGDEIAQINTEFRRSTSATMGHKLANQKYVWAAAKRGIEAEQKYIDKLFAEVAADDAIVVPEPVE